MEIESHKFFCVTIISLVRSLACVRDDGIARGDCSSAPYRPKPEISLTRI